jgi:hypothetical protein
MAALIDTYLGGIKRAHGECRASQERTHKDTHPRSLVLREELNSTLSASLSPLYYLRDSALGQ